MLHVMDKCGSMAKLYAKKLHAHTPAQDKSRRIRLGCDEHATCANTGVGTHKCTCAGGFFGPIGAATCSPHKVCDKGKEVGSRELSVLAVCYEAEGGDTSCTLSGRVFSFWWAEYIIGEDMEEGH